MSGGVRCLCRSASDGIPEQPEHHLVRRRAGQGIDKDNFADFEERVELRGEGASEAPGTWWWG